MLDFIIVLVLAGLWTPFVIYVIKEAYMNNNDEKEKCIEIIKKKKISKIIGFGGTILVLIVLIILSAWTEILWFTHLGFSAVFWKRFWLKWSLFIGGATITYTILWVIIRPTWKVVERKPTTHIRRTVIFISGLLALLAGALWSAEWEKVILFINQIEGAISDPIFHKNISFYLFSYPIYRKLIHFLILIFISGIAGTIIIRGEVDYYQSLGPDTTYYVKKITPLIWHRVAALFILAAAYYWLRIYSLMYSERGVVFGASYTDIHAQFWAYRIIIVISLAAAAGLPWLGQKSNKLKLKAVGGLIIAWLLIVVIYPALFQYMKVRPNELDREKPYIKYNIKFTRQAFGLDRIKEKAFPVKNDLTAAMLDQNQATIDNIRLWDWRALKSSFKQIQEIRLYYEFLDIDIDRYNIDGQYKEVMLAGREIMVNQLPNRSQTWVNQHLKYTHGYGLCLNRVNEFSKEGLPRLLVKDIPPSTTATKLKILRPEIYYGEGTKNYVLVNTTTDEFDYPRGDDNVYCQYHGQGGVKLGAGLRKLAWAWKLGDFKILISQYLRPETRVMFRRQIIERLETIAPFLRYDSDPYLVIAGGKLYFIVSAYTASAYYPYAERHQKSGINYIRDAVKVVIDAYNGWVDFYVVDQSDIIIRTWRKIFPSLFKPLTKMPIKLRQHIRYGEDLFKIQTEMYGVYHMANPEVFYNKEDMWVRAKEEYINKSQLVEPYFIMMRLPSGKEVEFMQILPFTPRGKNNLIAWLASRSDEPNYGQLIAYKFPKNKYIQGPLQIESKINQHPEMSRYLTLWKSKGSDVIRGNLLVIPIDQSLLYVEPIYLKADNSPLPQLRKVVVAYGENLVWADNFKEALRAIFQSQREKREMSVAKRKKIKKEGLLNSIQYYYNEYRRLMGKGKFSQAGQALEELGRLIKKLK